MIKKIFLLLLILIVCLFLAIFYVVDKIFISKYIKNLEDNLNVSITLKEPHNLKIVPNLSLLAKFNLEKNKKKIFFNNGELYIQKDYNLNKPFFNFNSKKITIDKLILNNLFISGEINKYNFKACYVFHPSLRYMIIANFSNIGDSIFSSEEWLHLSSFYGYSLGYGLETMFGPIEVKYHWSPDSKFDGVFVNLGYWF